MRKPAKTPGPTDGQIYRRALGIGVAGVAVVAISVGLTAGPNGKAAAFFRRFAPPPEPAVAKAAVTPPEHRMPEPLTAELRKKGYHECFPHDPIGLGPYAPFKNLSLGRIAIPQKGGHTDDMGYDVVIHFHGQSPVRKTLVQVARGVTFVGIDRGLGSGAYSDAFPNPDVFQGLVRSIEATLKKQSGDERAHVRHLALSAWSAGYGAINEILKYGDSRIDAVILLDGLHAGWHPNRSHDAGVSALSSLPISPTFRFAKKALAGEKIFVFTHTEITPDGYPSTRLTADLLLNELGLTRTAVDPGDARFGLTGTVDQAGLHVWSTGGTNEAAHCAHIPLIARALHVIEDAWDTPPLDRSVPPTPAPVLGVPDGGSEGISVELVPAAELEPPPNTLAAALGPAAAELELLPEPAPVEDPAPPAAAPVPAEPPPAADPALRPDQAE